MRNTPCLLIPGFFRNPIDKPEVHQSPACTLAFLPKQPGLGRFNLSSRRLRSLPATGYASGLRPGQGNPHAPARALFSGCCRRPRLGLIPAVLSPATQLRPCFTCLFASVLVPWKLRRACPKPALGVDLVRRRRSAQPEGG